MKQYSPICDYLSFSFDVVVIDSVISLLTQPGRFIEYVASDLPRPVNMLSSRPANGRLGYSDCIEYYSGDFVAFRLYYGGQNHLRPLVISTGYKADFLRKSLYEIYRTNELADIKITRIDIAIDFIRNDYERMVYLLDCRAECSNIKSSVVGDFLRGRDGRTLYLGSRSSRFFFRLYEKGIESSGIENHVRAELEIKCDKKHVSDQILPSLLDMDRILKFWRFSSVMFEVIGYDPDDIERETIKTVKGLNDDFSTIYHMHRNYGLMFKKLCGMFGVSAVTEYMLTDKSNIEGIQDVRQFFDSCYRS